MKNSFINRFREFIEVNKLLHSRDKVLVGFSGGADSTALLLSLLHLRNTIRFSILAVHINYNLRGNDSRKDEEFVKNFCFQRNISLVLKNIKIKDKKDLENQARKIRFDYFNQLVTSYKLSKIALGHNKNDQAETLLFRLFRGSGHKGLGGIEPKIGLVIHPLLPFLRSEITEFLEQNNLTWCEDKTNNENIQSRNVIRNKFIPLLQAEMNPNIIEKLYNTSVIFSETNKILENSADRWFSSASEKGTRSEYFLNLKVLLRAKSVIRFYIYKKVFSDLTGSDKDFYHSNFDELESILKSNGSKIIYLPRKVKAVKQYKYLIFYKTGKPLNFDPKNSKVIDSIRRRSIFEDYRIIMKKLKKLPAKHYPFEDENTGFFDLDKVLFPIRIRHRKEGDKFRPFGMEHHKKIKDYFIDEKIPKFDRDKILIFCDKEKIIWIAGHRIDNNVAVTEKSTNILMIKIEKISTQKARHAERKNKKENH